MAEIGKAAPEFKLKSHDGSEVSLSQFKGSKWLVVSAYPFAFTGGWSNQTSNFNRALKQFDEKGAQVLGLSCDPVPALKVWAQSMGGVGYPLLSDFFPHGKVSQALGILNAEGGFALRSVTLIDPQGIVRASHTYPAGVLPQTDEVLRELAGLQGG